MKMRSPIKARTVALMELAGAAGILTYWILYAAGALHSDGSQIHAAFERAFPPADLVLAAALTFSALALLRNRPGAARLSLACGGALVFLALLDISFNVQNGVYVRDVLSAATAAVVNLASLALGMVLMVTSPERN
jgi:lipopolysaccharide export LptBFGC system permease protein LptF